MKKILALVSAEEVEYIEDTSQLDSYCIYQDGTKSDLNKYNFSNSKKYLVYEKE